MNRESDELYDGRRIKILTLVDNFTCESLVIEVDQSLSGRWVVEVLMDVVLKQGLLLGKPVFYHSCKKENVLFEFTGFD